MSCGTKEKRKVWRPRVTLSRFPENGDIHTSLATWLLEKGEQDWLWHVPGTRLCDRMWPSL